MLSPRADTREIGKMRGGFPILRAHPVVIVVATFGATGMAKRDFGLGCHSREKLIEGIRFYRLAEQFSPASESGKLPAN